MKRKGNRRQFVIEIEEKDICAVIRYQDFINKHLKEGNRIPSKVLIGYFSLLKIEESRIKNETKERFSKVKIETLNNYLNNSEFNFNEKLPFLDTFQDPFNLDKKIYDEKDCNLIGLIDYVFANAESKSADFVDKKNTILLLNSYINLYFAQFKVDSIVLFTKYKRDVLIGFITLKLGFTLSKEIKPFGKQAPTNQMLHQAVKHFTSNK